MSNLKKVLSLMLALVLVFSLSAVSFASYGETRDAEDNELTIWQKEILQKIIDERKAEGLKALTKAEENRALGQIKEDMRREYITSGGEYDTFAKRLYNRDYDQTPGTVKTPKVAPKVSTYGNSDQVMSTAQRFDKYYSNNIVVLNNLSFEGDTAQISVNLGKEFKNPILYSYDYDGSEYNLINTAKYSSNSQGKITVNSSIGGIVVISEGYLAKR